jgi:hypothetical protein
VLVRPVSVAPLVLLALCTTFFGCKNVPREPDTAVSPPDDAPQLVVPPVGGTTTATAGAVSATRDAQPTGSSFRSIGKRAWHWLTSRSGRWVDVEEPKGGVNAQAQVVGFKSRYMHIFADFRPGRQWWLPVEVLLSVIIGCLDGVRRELCKNVLYGFALSVGLQTLLALWFRPFDARFQMFFLLLNSLLTAASTGIAVASSASVLAPTTANAALAWIAVGAQLTSSVQLGMDLLNFAVNFNERRRRRKNNGNATGAAWAKAVRRTALRERGLLDRDASSDDDDGDGLGGNSLPLQPAPSPPLPSPPCRVVARAVTAAGASERRPKPPASKKSTRAACVGGASAAGAAGAAAAAAGQAVRPRRATRPSADGAVVTAAEAAALL